MVSTRGRTSNKKKSAAAKKAVTTPTQNELTVVLVDPQPRPKHLCAQFVAQSVLDFQNQIQDYCAKRVYPSDETMKIMVKTQQDIETLYKNYVNDSPGACSDEAELHKVCGTYKRRCELIYTKYLEADPSYTCARRYG